MNSAACRLPTRTLLPGRRGRAARVDFRLYPLSFAEYVEVAGVAQPALLGYAAEPEPSPDSVAALTRAFENYLLHGGFLTAINDMAAEGLGPSPHYVTW